MADFNDVVVPARFAPDERVVLVDVETAGLDQYSILLEVGVLVIDLDFNTIGWFHRLICPHIPEHYLYMAEFVREMHTKNGLLKDCYKDGRERGQVGDHLIRWAKESGLTGGDPMGGSNSQFDRNALLTQLFHADREKLGRYWHYRNIDVSSTKETFKRFRKDVEIPEFKRNIHRVTEDLDDTREELRFYVEKLRESK